MTFEERADRMIRAGGPTQLTELDRLITDGCAESMGVELELTRLERRVDEALARGDVQELFRLRQASRRSGHRLADLDRRVRELMGLRARLRLREFASRSAL